MVDMLWEAFNVLCTDGHFFDWRTALGHAPVKQPKQWKEDCAATNLSTLHLLRASHAM